MELVFVGGIHGSGKSYLLDRISSKIDLEILTASDVLKWKEYSDNPDSKLVKSITETQDRLINNLNLILKPDTKYLLNGHFCLLNKDGKVERVPEDTFINMSPKSLYVKIAEVATIFERLKNRDDKKWSLDLIENMQNEEVRYAKELSVLLKIPVHIIKDDEENMFETLLQKDIDLW